MISAPAHPRPRHRDRAFTLTEVLIALALMLFLLVGVSQIFRITSKTIGSGRSLSASLRSQSAVRSVLEQDIAGAGLADPRSGIVPADEAPFLTISNMRVPGFLRKKNEDAAVEYGQRKSAFVLAPGDTTTSPSDVDEARSIWIRTVDRDGDGTEDPTRPLGIFDEGLRNFRVDTLSFFARGRFTRQTGRLDLPGRAALAGTDLTVENAWIWYGHLRTSVGDPSLITSPAGYAAPGVLYTPAEKPGDPPRLNKNNLYASQFTLGRVVTMLRQPERITRADGTTALAVLDDRRVPQWFALPSAGSPLSPLSSGTPIVAVDASGKLQYVSREKLLPADDVTASEALRLEQGLVDLAGASLGDMRERVSEFQDRGWPWHATLFTSHGPASGGGRFWFNPFPETAPVASSSLTAAAYSAAGASEQSKVLAPGCSQFIVEYAGDFLTQNTDPSNKVTFGRVLRAMPDGQIDFAVVNDARQVKWYGLPRDVNGDGVLTVDSAWHSGDVQPLRDMLIGWPGPTKPPEIDIVANEGGRWRFRFEKAWPDVPANLRDYLLQTAESSPAGGMTVADTSAYVCAFGPAEFDAGFRPVMLRITVDLADASGALEQPARGTYVFHLR